MESESEFGPLELDEDMDSKPSEFEEDLDSKQLVLPGSNAEPHIAIWGTQQTGKTVYLATLFHTFLTRRDSSTLPPWKMMARGENTQAWIKDIYTRMIQDCIFPPSTQVGEHHFPSFDLKDEFDTMRLRFTFLDASGEMYRDPDKYQIDHKLRVHPIEYLRSCTGLLILLDPIQAIRGTGNETFSAITNTLIALSHDQYKNPHEITKPVALCITKCDDPDCRSAFDDPTRFAERTFGKALLGVIKTYLKNCQWFACSALGFTQGEPTNVIRRWDGEWGIRNKNRIEPINIAEPIVWLANQIPQRYTIETQ